MTEAIVGLGSNLGDRKGHLDAALEGLRSIGSVQAVSSIYETAPIGGPPQDPFLNMVVALDTQLDPAELMAQLRAIEDCRDRQRSVPAAPRTLDVDLLLFGNSTRDEPGLRIPHPRMLGRRFVIEPLLEVRPKAKLPDGREVADYLAVVAHQEVRRWEGTS